MATTVKPTNIISHKNKTNGGLDTNSSISSPTEHRPMSCSFACLRLLSWIWILMFAFIGCGVGAIFAMFRPHGPQIMFFMTMALFSLSLVLPRFAHDGSVYAASFLFMLIPIGPLKDYSFGTEAWTWIAASVLVIVIFQTRFVLLTIITTTTTTTAGQHQTTKASPSSSSSWKSFFTDLILVTSLLLIVAILVFDGSDPNTKNDNAAIPRNFTWRLIATLAWLYAALLFVLATFMIPRWMIMRKTWKAPNGTTHTDPNTTTKLLYATLTMACAVNLLTSLLADYPSDLSIPCALTAFVWSLSAAYVSLNHGNRYLDAMVFRSAKPTFWNEGKVYLDDETNSILHEGVFTPKTDQQARRLVTMMVIWITSLVALPLYTISSVFILRIYNFEDHPWTDTIASWLFVALPVGFVLLFFISWTPLRYKVVQSKETSTVAWVVECAGATYVYDHVLGAYKGTIPSYIQSRKSYCTTATAGGCVVVVTTNQHIQLTPQNPEALIQTITLAVSQQPRQQSDNLELVARQEREVGDMAPLLGSDTRGNPNNSQNEKLLELLKLQHPFKIVALLIWSGSLLCSAVLWFFANHCGPWLGLGLSVAMLTTSLFLATPPVLDVSVVGACCLFFSVGRGGNDGSADLWVAVAAYALTVVCFQTMLLSRWMASSSSSSLRISPTPLARWLFLPALVAIVWLLVTHASHIMWLILAVTAVTTLVMTIALAPLLVWTIHACTDQRNFDNQATRRLLYATLTFACMASISTSALNSFPNDFSFPCNTATMMVSFAAACVASNNGDGYLDGQRTITHCGRPTPRARFHLHVSNMVVVVWVLTLLVTPLAALVTTAVLPTHHHDSQKESAWIWLSLAGFFVVLLFGFIFERPVRFNVAKSEETSVVAVVVQCVGATYVYDRVSKVYKGAIPSHVEKRYYHVTRHSMDGVVVVTANVYIMINPEDADAFVTELELAIGQSNDV